MRFIKYLMVLIIATILLLTMVSCEDSILIVDVEMGKFPNKIVYFIGSDFEIDMGGATIFLTTKNENTYEDDVTERNYCTIEHNVDFSTPGVYEVSIIRAVASKEYIFRFPVVVIDPEAIDPSSF